MTGLLGTESSRHFLDFADEFLKGYFEYYPTTASYLGLHEHDGQLPAFSQEAITGRIARLDAALEEIHKVDTTDFDPETEFDYKLLEQGIEFERFRLAELREHTYNPLNIVFLADVSNYIKRDYAPIESRIRSMITHEQALPKTMSDAQALLETPLARPIVQIGIEMAQGQLSYLRDTLPGIVSEQIHDADLLMEFQKANSGAVDAVNSFVEYLTGQLAGAKEDFAIGPELFSRMLSTGEMVDLPLERVLEVGSHNLEANKQAFIETARLIDPNKDASAVAEDVAADHPTEESLIPDTADMLEEIRQYLIDKDIVTVPSEVRCKVRETPEFMRWGFAFMDPAGPFETKATESYYYVTPVDQKWTPEQKEEWLRRFNYGTLRDVSVHEAYPGHYVHFLHSMNVMSPLRKVFGSYSFIEGWAHYCEQMMVEEGYRDESPHLKLAQLSEALLRNSRYVVAIMMHTGRMTLDEATKFLMDNAFLEELPAQREAVRGTFDPGYLNYTLGKLLLLKLRDDLKAKQGEHFNLKQFHDKVLSFGYPPVPLLRTQLLGPNAGDVL